MARLTPLHAADLNPALWHKLLDDPFRRLRSGGHSLHAGLLRHLQPGDRGLARSNASASTITRSSANGRSGSATATSPPTSSSRACMGDELSIAVAVERIGRASFALTLHAMKGETGGLARPARDRHHVIDRSTRRSRSPSIFWSPSRPTGIAAPDLLGRVLRRPEDDRRILLVGHAVRIGDRLELQPPGREEVEDVCPAAGPCSTGSGPMNVFTPFESR